MTIETFEEPRHHRRAPGRDLLDKRAALSIVLPLRRQIGAWQSRAVTLNAMSERLRASGHYNPSHVAEAEALLSAIRHHRDRLAGTTAGLPPELRTNSHIVDVERALQGLEVSLNRVVTPLT